MQMVRIGPMWLGKPSNRKQHPPPIFENHHRHPPCLYYCWPWEE